MIKRSKIPVFLLPTFLLSTACQFGTNDSEYLEQRSALIKKYSLHDPAIPAMHRLKEAEDTFSRNYWRFKIDQYLYGQYTEFQPIYDAFRNGRTFEEVYGFDLEPTLAARDSSDPETLPEIPEGYFTENLPRNTHTGSSLFFDGKLYIAYEGQLTDPYIASYDIGTNTWEGPYKAGHSTLSKDGRRVDSHGRPALELNDNGHFHIVFGGHGGEWEDGLNPMSIDTAHAGGRMLHVASARPLDISEWKQQDDISPFASYTSLIKMGNGDIYFFTRAGTHKSPWVYYKMESGSDTFAPPVIFTWPTISENDPIDVDTFYMSPKRISDTEIAITYLWHICNFREYHDRVTYSRINTYYMKMDTSDDTFYNVEGKKLELPITRKTADKHTLAYDSEATGETCFNTRPLTDQNGRPAAAYEALGPGYREWRMVAYENGKWTHGLPMPGTESRSLVDADGKPIDRILDLAKIKTGPQATSAVVTYHSNDGKTVFATATSGPELGNPGLDWKVETEYAAVAGAGMQMQAVRDENGEAVAIVLNIRKGASQRLYLWHDGEFRPAH